MSSRFLSSASSTLAEIKYNTTGAMILQYLMSILNLDYLEGLEQNQACFWDQDVSLGTCNTDASIWGQKSNFTWIIMVGMSGSKLYLWDCCCCCRPTVLAELTAGTRADLKDWLLHELFYTDITNSTIKRLLFKPHLLMSGLTLAVGQVSLDQ